MTRRSSAPAIHQFGDFELDEGRYQLRRRGELVPLEPRVLDVLRYLVQRRDRLVPKRELLEACWPGVTVGDAALTRCIALARRAVGDDARSQRAIRTVHRRGYRFVAAARSYSPAAGAVPATAPFVGRERELSELHGALERAVAGGGSSCLIAGEPGIGKTRLAAEFAAQARARGAAVWFGRCREGVGASAFWPWVQIVRAALEHCGARHLRALLGREAAHVARMVPELRDALPDLEPVPTPDRPGARLRTFEAMTRLLLGAAQRQVLVLVLDDLHHSDPSSLRLFEFLAPELAEHSLLTLGLYRDPDPNGRRAIASLLRQPGARPMYLEGLSTGAVGSFVDGALGWRPTAAAAAELREQTGGNPFLLTQTIPFLRAEDLAVSGRCGLSLAAALPDGVRSAIARQLDGLGAADRRLLAVAAVIGREFTPRELARASGTPWRTVVDRLEAISRARLVLESPSLPRTHRFTHALVRDLLYDGIPGRDRARLHQRVGTALEEIHAGATDACAAELAYHFTRAAPAAGIGKAVAYSRRAGAIARVRLAYEDAEKHYQSAVVLLETQEPRDEALLCDTLLALGECQARSGDRAGARRSCLRAASSARRCGSPPRLAGAALTMSSGLTPVGGAVFDAELVEHLEQSLHALDGRHDALRARVLQRLALVLYSSTAPSGYAARREEVSEQAAEIAARVRDPAVQAYALSARHLVLLTPDRCAERRALVRRVAALAQRAEDLDLALAYRVMRVCDLIEVGAVAAVDSEIGRFVRMARTLRQPDLRWFPVMLCAMRAQLEGRFQDAERAARRALEVGRDLQDPKVSQAFGCQLAFISAERGRFEVSEPILKPLAREHSAVPGWRYGLAWLRAQQGRSAEARAEFEELAKDDFEGVARDRNWAGVGSFLADCCGFLGDARRAARLYDLLLPYRHLYGVLGVGYACLGSGSRVLGVLSGVAGRFEDSVAHFETALRMNRRIAARPQLARTELDFAGLLLRRGRPGDAARAANLLRDARASAAQLGMVAVLARAERVARSARL